MEQSHAIRDRKAHLLGIVFGFGIEQRLADDGQGEPGHLIRDVHRLIVAPPFPSQTIGVNCHDLGVTRDAIPMESRLREAPLPLMKLTFTGQKPITQHSFGLLEPTSFLKARLIRHQYGLDVVGIVDKEVVL